MTSAPRFVPPGQRLRDALLGRRVRTRTRPLDDGSTLDVRCPACAAQLRARCGRTNSCPRCREQVAVPGADVARALVPATGDAVEVRRKLTGDDPGARTIRGPLLVIGYEPPHYLVRVRGQETGWVHDAGVRLVLPRRS